MTASRCVFDLLGPDSDLEKSYDSLPSRVRSNSTPHEKDSLKGDHLPPKPAVSPDQPPVESQEIQLEQLAATLATRLEDYIKDAMQTYAEDLKYRFSEFEVREFELPEEEGEDFEYSSAASTPTFATGQTTAFENAQDATFRPRRLNPSVILTPESTAPSDDEDGFDDEDWKRYEKEITDSAKNLNRNVSEKIERERKEYLAAVKKHYLKAKVESPENAKQEGEKGILIFKNLMGWVNNVFDKVTTLFRRFFREFFNNFETAMSWVAEQLANISYKHTRIPLEYKAN
ncbi:hypothetical protein TWF481_007531 [Arthrobotrys musiformis]|uniref:Uncharacterized protein n=1 Tax=Arthrobotrys musiformis TaxID=47236 RepID=A0AAV9WCR9_9PEZI